MPIPPPPSPPVVIEIAIHFDAFGALRYEGRPARETGAGREAGFGSVDPVGDIDLTKIHTPVVPRFSTDPADHHPFDPKGALFTSDAPFIHTQPWRPDDQFRRVRLSDHGYTLTIDYQNIAVRRGRPMPANGYDLSFARLKRHGGDPAIRNGAVLP